ncbi:MAG TPA: hypothetical protein VGF82_25960 [Terracidiphilus sp.]|jgi:hypothetical protein
MVICIEIEQRTKNELDHLLKVGDYKDYSQAVAIAISNQVLLQRQVAPTGNSLIVAGDASPQGKGNFQSRLDEAPPKQDMAEATTTSIPAIFLLPTQKLTNCEAAPLPNDVFVAGQEVPVDRWIFGQHNKILPVKASCRALAALCRDARGIPLKAAADIAAQAAKLGDYLRQTDTSHLVSRDDALALAFPSTGSEAGDKARLRFANQFVASANKQGQLSGLPVDLKLINYISAKESRLSLTGAGWQFAAMPNPILDRSAGDVVAKFSDEEIGFLVHHIRDNIPVEDSAYRTVIRALNEGANTPERLDDYLAQFVPARAEKPFTRAFLTTQRSGVISRMSDLGMLTRRRDGIKVTYVTTERAIQYFSTNSHVTAGVSQ